MKIVKGSRVQLVCEVFVLKLPLKTNSFRVSHYLLHNGELKLQICWKIYIGLFFNYKASFKTCYFYGRVVNKSVVCVSIFCCNEERNSFILLQFLATSICHKKAPLLTSCNVDFFSRFQTAPKRLSFPSSF